MKRTFIYTELFSRKWNELGLNQTNDLYKLELFLLENPDAGEIMQGTGGIRKLRWALPYKGKSGGIRVLYLDFIIQETIIVFDLFSKGEKENLSKMEKNSLKEIVKLIGKELKP